MGNSGCIYPLIINTVDEVSSTLPLGTANKQVLTVHLLGRSMFVRHEELAVLVKDWNKMTATIIIKML